MAKYIRPKQLAKQTVIRQFAMKWSTSARVDFYLVERQTRACSYLPCRRWYPPAETAPWALYTYIYIHIHMYIHNIYTYIYIRTHRWIHTSPAADGTLLRELWLELYTYIYIYIYIHIYIHIHIHMYIPTHKWIHTSPAADGALLRELWLELWEPILYLSQFLYISITISIAICISIYEQALVSLRLKKIIDAEVCWPMAVVIEGI